MHMDQGRLSKANSEHTLQPPPAYKNAKDIKDTTDNYTDVRNHISIKAIIDNWNWYFLFINFID